MLLRRVVDGALVAAKLMLDGSSQGGRRFLLATRGQSAARAFVGPLSAAIGYAIVRASPRERAALLLAGHRLREAVPSAATIQVLAAMLRREREKSLAKLGLRTKGMNVRRDPPAAPGRTAHRKTRSCSPGESSATPI